jgi:nitrite reductase (NO-forming)
MVLITATRGKWLQALDIGGTTAVAGCSIRIPSADSQAAQQTALAARLEVESTSTPTVDRVAADPTDIPRPIERDEPTTVEVMLRPEAVTVDVADDETFDSMTYNGEVPGPLIRVRQGDTVELTFKNLDSNVLPHYVDFHAARGPGAAGATMTSPDETAHLWSKATSPGAYIHHCAVPNLDTHFTAGMLGLIPVEPPEGLPAVEHESSLGQHELYAKGDGEKLSFDIAAIKREDPCYVVMKDEQYAITATRHGPVTVGTDETVRVFFVTGGPHLTSSFHPIGSVLDEFWRQGRLSMSPQTHTQTWPVAPDSTGIATMASPPREVQDHRRRAVPRRSQRLHGRCQRSGRGASGDLRSGARTSRLQSDTFSTPGTVLFPWPRLIDAGTSLTPASPLRCS